jgi:hypothetical protein
MKVGEGGGVHPNRRDAGEFATEGFRMADNADIVRIQAATRDVVQGIRNDMIERDEQFAVLLHEVKSINEAMRWVSFAAQIWLILMAITVVVGFFSFVLWIGKR